MREEERDRQCVQQNQILEVCAGSAGLRLSIAVCLVKTAGELDVGLFPAKRKNFSEIKK